MELINPSADDIVRYSVPLVPGRLYWVGILPESKRDPLIRRLLKNAIRPKLKSMLRYKIGTYKREMSAQSIQENSPPKLAKPTSAPSSEAQKVSIDDPIVIMTDKILRYNPLVHDFGPVDLATTCRYFDFLDEITRSGSAVIHVSNCDNPVISANSAYLIALYSVYRYGLSPLCVDRLFQILPETILPPFRDASRMKTCTFPLRVRHFCEALRASIKYRWMNWQAIQVDAIERMQRVEYGDLNWIVEGKFLAFAGPSSSGLDEDGLEVHTPDYYARLFSRWGIRDVVRLNVANYDPSEFEAHGIRHHDLYFEDGSCPPPRIVEQFLNVARGAKGGVAVHCKAGLGRTGTLIGLAVMDRYKVPAHVYIAWARMARPGSVIGPQQHFLVEMEQHILTASRKRKDPPSEIQHLLGSGSEIGLHGDQGQANTLLQRKRRTLSSRKSINSSIPT
jgi:protein-tyrosine phosphatase